MTRVTRLAMWDWLTAIWRERSMRSALQMRTYRKRGPPRIVRLHGKWWLTPMFVVIVAIGSADVMFAVDSIPAIFGITNDPFLVFTANAFALMGLRQLYFLLGGLLNKLAYLWLGLAVLLGFIGLKLILHALYQYHLVALDIGNWTSLVVIVAVLVATMLASLLKSRRDGREVGAGGGARR